MINISFDTWENELCHYGVKGMTWRNKKGAQAFYRLPDEKVINLRPGQKSGPDAMRNLVRKSAGIPTQQQSAIKKSAGMPTQPKTIGKKTAGKPTEKTALNIAKDIQKRSAQLKVAKVEKTTNKKESAPSGKRTVITNPIYQNRKKQMRKSR